MSTPTTMPLSTTMAIPTNLASCVDWYETNTLMAEVYFERMDFESNVETPAYPVLYLLSDIGGQMGFWLGMSVISLIEIIFFFFNVFQCFCCPSKISDAKKIDNEPNTHKESSPRKLSSPESCLL
uniref:Uncharacterized protein n=1 Tax=Acrobeloides nanus TaxID=290746 RepID=A0A914C7M3_9BILA